MNTYVTAEIIKQLREKKGLTQSGLAKIIGVSNQAVNKWETGKGLPDISLIEPLSAALSVSAAGNLSKSELLVRGFGIIISQQNKRWYYYEKKRQNKVSRAGKLFS